MVSEENFWLKFFTAPATISVFYNCWNSLPPTLKNRWSNKNKIQKAFIITTDLLAKTLFSTRVLQSLLMNINDVMPKPMLRPVFFEYIAIPTGIGVLIGQLAKKNYWQKFETSMVYAMTASLMFYMFKFLEAELHEHSKEQVWSLLVKCILFPTLFATGLLFTGKHGKRYLQDEARTIQVHRTDTYIMPYEQGTCDAVQSHLNKNFSQFSSIVSEVSTHVNPQEEVDRQQLKFAIKRKILASAGYEVSDWAVTVQQNTQTVDTIRRINNMSVRQLLENTEFAPITQEVLKELKGLGLLPLLDLQAHSPSDFEMPPHHSNTVDSESALLLFSNPLKAYGSVSTPEAAQTAEEPTTSSTRPTLR
jgi:hypothetical protein